MIRFLPLLLLLFLGCSKEKPTLIPVKDLVFNLNAPFTQSQLFTDKKGNEYFFFADYYSKNRLAVYALNGTLKKTISLKEVTKKGAQIDGYIIKSLDTVLVLGRYSNTLHYIKNSGELYNQIDLNRTIPHSTDKYEFCTAANNTAQNNEIVLDASWLRNSSDSPPNNPKEYLKYFYRNKNNSYHFLSLQNAFNNPVKSDFKVKAFNKHFQRNNETLHFDLPNYFINGSDLFVYTIHSDTLYNFALPSYELKRKIKITSEHSPIGEAGLDLRKEIDPDGQEFINRIAHYGGVIGKIVHDKYHNLYYVSVPHKTDFKKDPNRKKLNRPFSLIIFNSKWKKLKEVVFPPGKYNFYDFHVCKQGIIISKNLKENKNYNPKIAQYELFKINL